ncbi:hypothetical protein ASD54_25280 [Rhizobium sp. Root149]|uniref:hypothetical protein n=1 Tax=Rhizobium sp. Root149 TaxID=1736473 RepID=UPI0007160217|nr:hypothetical protein [Rhizobium sp. Root149]KQZ56257.1 hypothetical protein ASD54_25280 [Rhizobium sp. Root149]
MAVDDQDRALTDDELAQARFQERTSRNRLNDLMQRSFLSPKRAMNRIQDARAEKGDRFVFDKLRDPKSRAYGRRPGSLLSRGGLRRGARYKRRDALLARRRLPEHLLDYETKADRLRGAERAHREARGSGPPDTKASFLSRLLKRPAQDAVPAPHQTPGKGFSVKDILNRPKETRKPSSAPPRRRGREDERGR